MGEQSLLKPTKLTEEHTRQAYKNTCFRSFISLVKSTNISLSFKVSTDKITTRDMLNKVSISIP